MSTVPLTKEYMRNIAKLQQYIAGHDYADGGWLPSGRKMAVTLRTTHISYCKALSFLAKEGIAVPSSTRGHYVIPEHLRCKKVGLIIGAGESISFIKSGNAQTDQGLSSNFSELVGAIAGSPYDLQLIQLPVAEQAFEIANAFAMKGLFWYNPPGGYLKAIKKGMKHFTPPFVMFADQDYGEEDSLDIIRNNYHDYLRQRVELMIARGHKKLLFLGSYQQLRLAGAIDVIREAGLTITKKDCFDRNFIEYGDITGLVKERRYTGIIANGLALWMTFLFHALNPLPEALKPEVLFYGKFVYNEMLKTTPDLIMAYPKSKLSYPPEVVSTSLGRRAAEALLAQLPQRSTG